MTISNRLKEYLQKENISYEVIHHRSAFTASETARVQHVPGKNMLKTVVVKSGDDFVMVVVPATHKVDFNKLGEILHRKNLELASEDEVIRLFPDFNPGAEPPFGHLYGLKVYIDKTIKNDKEVVFNGGTHTDLIKMKVDDFFRLSKGMLEDVGQHI